MTNRPARYYSIGQAPATSPRQGAWIILGWSRTREAVQARRGTRYWTYATTRAQAARRLKAECDVDVDPRR